MARSPLARTHRRNRHTLRRVAASALAVAGLALLAAGYFITSQGQPTDVVAIVIESRDVDAQPLSADVHAQLDRAEEQSAEVIIVDATDATAAHVSFACPAGATGYACRLEQEEARQEADAALARALDSDHEASDLPASLRRIDEQLRQLRSAPVGGAVIVYLNLTGRHREHDLDTTRSDVPDNVHQPARTAAERGLLPQDCSNWQVHLIAPEIDPAVLTKARDDALAAMLSHCDGDLDDRRARFVADGDSFAVLDRRSDDDPEPPPPPEPEEPDEPRRVRHELDDAHFNVGETDLTAAGSETISRLAEDIAAHHHAGRRVEVHIDGYASHTGPDTLNETLAAGRAATVANALIDASDLDTDDVTYTGRGSLDPPNSHVGEIDEHRRVDITITVSDP